MLCKLTMLLGQTVMAVGGRRVGKGTNSVTVCT